MSESRCPGKLDNGFSGLIKSKFQGAKHIDRCNNLACTFVYYNGGACPGQGYAPKLFGLKQGSGLRKREGYHCYLMQYPYTLETQKGS